MKDRITQMEKDLRSTYALAAIINKKSEIAADVERYTLGKLHKATESLNCKFPDPFAYLLATSCLGLLLILLAVIAMNHAEENKRIHERVHALTQLSSSEEIF